jgi:hypothetical protein
VSEGVLTARHLNRALLARQLLLERARLPIHRAVERIAGLQTQYAPSAYVGLWTRLENFERDALTRALERRSVVQATLMRSTIHIVSRADFWPLAVAVRRAQREWYLRRGPLPDPETPAPVRFLPHWDGNLLAHARRAQILPERYRPRVFTSKNPFSVATFLVDGAVAGIWRLEKGRIVVEPYKRLSRQVRKELEEEAERLQAFHA